MHRKDSHEWNALTPIVSSLSHSTSVRASQPKNAARSTAVTPGIITRFNEGHYTIISAAVALPLPLASFCVVCFEKKSYVSPSPPQKAHCRASPLIY